MKRIRTVVLALVAVAALILVLAKVAGKQIGYVLFTRAARCVARGHRCPTPPVQAPA